MVSALLLQADSKEKYPKSIITFLSDSGRRNCTDVAANLPSTLTENTPKIRLRRWTSSKAILAKKALA